VGFTALLGIARGRPVISGLGCTGRGFVRHRKAAEDFALLPPKRWVGTPWWPPVYLQEMSKLYGVTALVVALVGCARPVSDTGVDRQTSSTVDAAKTDVPADAAGIVCTRGATLIDTPVVVAGSDGVRVVISNPGDVWGFEFHPVSFEYGQAMGGDFPRDGDAESPWTMPPGEVMAESVNVV
jgi:hypothetical protein